MELPSPQDKAEPALVQAADVPLGDQADQAHFVADDGHPPPRTRPDGADPYHLAKAEGLNIVGSSEITILLYDHGRITYETAASSILQTHAGEKLKRLALVTLETLKRQKES